MAQPQRRAPSTRASARRVDRHRWEVWLQPRVAPVGVSEPVTPRPRKQVMVATLPSRSTPLPLPVTRVVPTVGTARAVEPARTERVLRVRTSPDRLGASVGMVVPAMRPPSAEHRFDTAAVVAAAVSGMAREVLRATAPVDRAAPEGVVTVQSFRARVQLPGRPTSVVVVAAAVERMDRHPSLGPMVGRASSLSPSLTRHPRPPAEPTRARTSAKKPRTEL